jgi:hypothetical protein
VIRSESACEPDDRLKAYVPGRIEASHLEPFEIHILIAMLAGEESQKKISLSRQLVWLWRYLTKVIAFRRGRPSVQGETWRSMTESVLVSFVFLRAGALTAKGKITGMAKRWTFTDFFRHSMTCDLEKTLCSVISAIG